MYVGLQKWFCSALQDETALPGSTDDGGYGRESRARELTYLTRVKTFEGQAWYQNSQALAETLEINGHFWREEKIGQLRVELPDYPLYEKQGDRVEISEGLKQVLTGVAIGALVQFNGTRSLFS